VAEAVDSTIPSYRADAAGQAMEEWRTPETDAARDERGYCRGGGVIAAFSEQVLIVVAKFSLIAERRRL